MQELCHEIKSPSLSAEGVQYFLNSVVNLMFKDWKPDFIELTKF